MPLLKSLALALSLAIDVFAVSVGIGIKQSDLRTRLRFATAFVCAELAMTLLGTLIGRVVFALIGEAAGYLGFAALIAVGLYVVYAAKRPGGHDFDLSRGFGLFVSALAISFDSLGIGFSILFIGVPFVPTIVAIVVCTIAATGLGFAIGKRVGSAFEARAELAAGVLLVLTGVAFAALKGSGHG